MTMRKLTTEEVNYLFTFVEQRDVKYYDVQMELVDHFASAIEKQWENNPELTFDEALRQEHKQFNKYDFSRIIDEKKSMLRKKYLQLQWRYVAEFFKLPKIVLTVTIFLTLLFAIGLTDRLSRVYAVIYTLAFFWIIILAVVKRRETKLNLLTDKTFVLFEEYRRIRGGYIASINLINILNLPIYIFGNDQFYIYFQLDVVKIAVTFIITSIIILSYVLMAYLPQRIKSDFIHEYPQFVKA